MSVFEGFMTDLAVKKDLEIHDLKSQLAQLTQEVEVLREACITARDTLKQLVSLANINGETKRILAYTGNTLNAALAMGKEK